MVVVVVAIATVLLSVPVIAILLVSVASRREDAAWTLAGPAPGPIQAAARRIVGFHSRGIEWLLYARAGRGLHHVRATTCTHDHAEPTPHLRVPR